MILRRLETPSTRYPQILLRIEIAQIGNLCYGMFIEPEEPDLISSSRSYPGPLT